MAAHRIPAINQFPPSHALHMNVAQFAAVGVVSKEWLFRITRREQPSPVLLTVLTQSVVVVVPSCASHWKMQSYTRVEKGVETRSESQ